MAVSGTGTGRGADRVWAVARIALGWVFLWAFLDKLFGLGIATPREGAWLSGGSPTTRYLESAAQGPVGGLYGALAGHVWVDVLFMAGLLGVGAALILGVGMRIAAGAGTVMLLLMWGAALPLTTNPFVNDHIVYSIVLIGLAAGNAGDTWGLGRRWAEVTRGSPVLR